MNHNLFKANFGLEREAIRVNRYGEVSSEKHPSCFGEKNPYITKDFAEAQLELITPVCNTIELAVNTLVDLQSVVLSNIGDDYLWNQSNPPIIPAHRNVPIAEFKLNPEKETYRKFLLGRYGKEKSIISGIHYNVSFDDGLLWEFYSESDNDDFSSFKNQLYLKVAKYLLRDRWFLMYLTNASPTFHKSYYKQCVDKGIIEKNGDCRIKGLSSLRNSECGYRNKDDYILDYSSVTNHLESLERVIKDNRLSGSSEVYSPVRLKFDSLGNIEYLELRFIDINPFEKEGVSKTDLKFIHMFMINALYKEDFDFDSNLQQVANSDHHSIAWTKDESNNRKEAMLNFLDEIVQRFENETFYNFEAIFENIKRRIKSKEYTYSERLNHEYSKSSFIEYHLQSAIKEKTEVLEKQYEFKSYPSLELSTKILIKEAIKSGVEYEVLDINANLLRLKMNDQTQFVQQATKTNLDGYANVLVMENKEVTKQILKEHNLSVPDGIKMLQRGHLSNTEYLKYSSNGIVVKPNTTNFGDGITIFPTGALQQEIDDAIEYAFSKDDTVLIEDFVSGKEYRFLVIGNEVVGILYRRAANVVGDGMSTIKELVERKNLHKYRGNNYVTPLEMIEISKIEIDYLALQNLSPESVISSGERVYLRENSNISTGGDSIDVTDLVHSSYSEIALKASLALGVEISGVDIIVQDIGIPADVSNYSILELNYNPAIHIHTYPLEGENRNPARKVLQLLFEDLS